MRNILVLLVLLFAVNSFAASWVEQLGLKERATAPDTQDRLGQVWVEQASKDLMFRDSLGVDYNILLGGGIGGAQLNDMSDVDTFTASPTVGQALVYDGTNWVPETPASSLSLLTDVALATPTEAQVLTYNNTTSKWENKNPTGKTLVGTSPITITQDANTATFSLSYTPENAANKSVSTLLGTSDTLYPSQNAVKSYVDEKKLSVGATTLMNIIDNGGGNITSSVLNVSFNTLATAAGTVKNYTVGSVTATLTDGVTNYVVANYNNGSPIQQVITDVSLINETTIVPIATIFRSGNFLHTLTWGTLGNGLSNKIHQSIVKTQRYRRESGLALSESGTRNVNISSGIIWTGANPTNILTAASSTDNLFYFLRTGPSAWTTQVLTQYNNNDYFNGTTTAVLTNNRYAVNWVYRGVETQKHIYIVLGEGDYSLSQAQTSQPPANLPQNITSHAVLVGRIIVLKGASTATQIDSAFSLSFTGAGVTDHASLTGLQGGTVGEYYHLTSAGKTAADTLTGTVNYVSKFTGTGLTASQIFDNGTNVGVGTASPTTKLDVSGDITTSGYIYFGNSTTNGSYRMYVSGTALVTEKRVSGSWVEVGRLDNN